MTGHPGYKRAQVATVAAVVITYNAEDTIEECLRSLRWADQVLVVDSESTDRTVELAQRLADRVVMEPWRGFSEQKNYAASVATEEWILHVAADEIVPPELAAEIRSVIAAPDKVVGYLIPRQTFWLGHWIRHNGWYPDYSMRLYRKSRARWEGLVHEKVVADGPVAAIRQPLQHYSYRSVQQHLERMVLRLAPLEAREAIERGIRIYKFFPFGPFAALVRRWWRGPRTAYGLREAYKDVLKNRVEIAWLLPFMPLMRFLYMYVVRLGFLDGVPGFWVATLSACYEAARLAKIWEYFHTRMGVAAAADERPVWSQSSRRV